MNAPDPARPRTDDELLNELLNATGAFLDRLAQKAQREQPAIYAVADAALASGEAYTVTTVKLYHGGAGVLASIRRISDDAELVRWDEVSGVAPTAQ